MNCDYKLRRELQVTPSRTPNRPSYSEIIDVGFFFFLPLAFFHSRHFLVSFRSKSTRLLVFAADFRNNSFQSRDCRMRRAD